MEKIFVQTLGVWWAEVLALATLSLALLVSCHAVLHKRDPRSAVGWVGLVWLVPILGACLYVLLGINRVRRQARASRRKMLPIMAPPTTFRDAAEFTISPDCLPVGLRENLSELAKLGETVISRPLLDGNWVVPLVNGDEAYPRMLEAIQSARKSISLSTYIFDNDVVGARFVDALAAAVERGVEVRILIDDIGARYSFPSTVRLLRRRGVPVRRFMGTWPPRYFPHLNLRKHRKSLIVDGKRGFLGGMNIRAGHEMGLRPKHPVWDIHFEIRGPVLSQVQRIFAYDWAFTSGEILESENWFPVPEKAGAIAARAVSDGPDEELGILPMVLHAAMSSARFSIEIQTPYFLPEAALSSALNVAAARGVRVDILLPEKNNLPYMNWAAMPQLPFFLKHGCRIWFSPPPFDHGKLMIVDRKWVMVGSANWDPRSLRLNFELNVECYSSELGTRMSDYFRSRLALSRMVTSDELEKRPLLYRLRNGFTRLLSPYL